MRGSFDARPIRRGQDEPTQQTVTPGQEAPVVQSAPLLVDLGALSNTLPAYVGATADEGIYKFVAGVWTKSTFGGVRSGPVMTSTLTMSTARLLGRVTAATGAIEELTNAAAKGFLAIVAADVGGLGYFATGTDAANLTGTVAAARFPAFTGDVTTAAGAVATTISNDAVTYAKMQNVSATNRFLGRITAGAGDPEELSGTQATTLLDVATSALKGLAPASGGGTTNFLRADLTWAAPPGGGGTPTGTGFTHITAGAQDAAAKLVDTADINADQVTYPKIQNVTATDRLLGRSTAGAGDIEEIICTAAGRALIDDVDAAAQRTTLGLATVASSGSAADLTGNLAVARLNGGASANASTFWRGDGTWVAAGIEHLASVKYDAAGAALGPAIADYFTTTISLEASSIYEIECHAYFLKTTAGTVVWTWTFGSAPTVATSRIEATPITGFTTATVTGAPVVAQATAEAVAAMAHAASGSLTTAVRHSFMFWVRVRTNAATTIQLRATSSAGTVTPQAGSYMQARKIV